MSKGILLTPTQVSDIMLDALQKGASASRQGVAVAKAQFKAVVDQLEKEANYQPVWDWVAEHYCHEAYSTRERALIRDVLVMYLRNKVQALRQEVLG